MIAYANGHTVAAQGLVSSIENVILFPFIALITAFAILMFLWGAFQYVYSASNGHTREEGSRHMLYGVIGLVIMLSAYAILKIVTATFGVPIS